MSSIVPIDLEALGKSKAERPYVHRATESERNVRAGAIEHKLNSDADQYPTSVPDFEAHLRKLKYSNVAVADIMKKMAEHESTKDQPAPEWSVWNFYDRDPPPLPETQLSHARSKRKARITSKLEVGSASVRKRIEEILATNPQPLQLILGLGLTWRIEYSNVYSIIGIRYYEEIELLERVRPVGVELRYYFNEDMRVRGQQIAGHFVTGNV